MEDPQFHQSVSSSDDDTWDDNDATAGRDRGNTSAMTSSSAAPQQEMRSAAAANAPTSHMIDAAISSALADATGAATCVGADDDHAGVWIVGGGGNKPISNLTLHIDHDVESPPPPPEQSTLRQRRPPNPHHDPNNRRRSSTETKASVYIDYIPPPVVPLPPPAKYKLFLTIVLLVYINGTLAIEADIQGALMSTGYLSFYAARFWMLFVELIVIIFFANDPLLYVARFKLRGKWYGLGPWLKRPRHTFLRPYVREKRVWAEIAQEIVSIAEEGFKIFNPPPIKASSVQSSPPSSPSSSLSIERGDGDRCGDGEREGVHRGRYPSVATTHIESDDEDDDDDNESDNDLLESDEEVVLKVEHILRPGVEKKYAKLKSRASQTIASQPGFLRYETDVPMEGDRHVFRIVFRSIDALHDFMVSPTRTRLVSKLQPLLLTPGLLQVRESRVDPGAFVDIVALQGRPVPVHPPKKWKACWIAIVGINLSLLITDAVLPFYYDAWGLAGESMWWKRLVGFASAVFLNSYVLTPLMNCLFSEWIRRKEGELDERQPWKALNDGLPLRVQVVGWMAWFVGCGVAWAF